MLTEIGDNLVFVGTQSEYVATYGVGAGQDVIVGDDAIVLFVREDADQEERQAAYEAAWRMVEARSG